METLTRSSGPTILTSLQRLYDGRELLLLWTWRDVRVRYKQSLLGVAWTVIQPLSLMLVFTVIFSWIVRIPTGDIPYPLFAYTALLPWTFFSSSVTFGVSSLVNNINLVTKVSMPREVLPIAAVLAGLLDFGIATLLLILLLLLYRVAIHWTVIWVFPLLVIQVLLTLGLVLLGSAVNVLYRDVRFVVPLAMQLWMYATPIIYPIDVVPEGLRWLYYLNPMAAVIDGYRMAILEAVSPDALAVGLASFTSIVVLFVGYMVFKRLEPSYADVI